MVINYLLSAGLRQMSCNWLAIFEKGYLWKFLADKGS